MSIYPPRQYAYEAQPYDKKALGYVEENQNIIQEVASRLGVSATAMAGSIAREITRSDEAPAFRRAIHHLLVNEALKQPESDYEGQYQEVEKELKANPGALDGNPIWPYLTDPTRRDIGPGSIKVATAINVIEQYADTPAGHTLGLGKYSSHDLREIVRDLNDKSNPLSIYVAGLITLNGQNFFVGKKIAGIPWSDLTQEQRDAALTAYYTVGEHAVAVDMAEDKFFPFTTGPKGGKVGPWILFGDNNANLHRLLNNSFIRKLSVPGLPAVAPIAHQRSTPKKPTGPQKHADLDHFGGFSRWAQNMTVPPFLNLTTLTAASNAVSQASAILIAAVSGPVSARRAAGSAVAPILNSPSLNSAMLQARPASFQMIAQAARVRSTALAAIPAGQNYAASAARKPAMAASDGPVGSAPAGELKAAQTVTSMLITLSQRPTLPSIAPNISAGRYVNGAATQVTSQVWDTNTEASPRTHRSELVAQNAVDRGRFGLALAGYFDEQARLPPSGATGFDPRLTPAWAGQMMMG